MSTKLADPDDPCYWWQKEADELRSENESYRGWAERMRTDNAEIAAENHRLRLALERLVDIGPSATLKEWRDAQAAGAQVLGR